MTREQAEKLCASVDSLIVRAQMALNDTRYLTDDHSQLTFKMRMVRQYLFEVKAELMDYGIYSAANPQIPPDDPQYSWAEVS